MSDPVENHRPRERGLSVRHKLLLFVVLGAAGIVSVGGIAYRGTERVKVGGPLFQQVVEGKDLIADILPPPAYIIETMLLANNMTRPAATAADRDALLARVTTLRQEFDARQQYWLEALPEGEVREQLVETSRRPALSIYGSLETVVVPAYVAGDYASVRRQIEGPLAALFAEHRAAIDELVRLVTVENAATGVAAASTISLTTTTLVGVGVGVLVLLVVVGFVMARAITRPLIETVSVLSQVAEGDLRPRIVVRSGDELGQMGHALNTALESLSSAMASIAQNAQALASSSEELSAVSTQMGSNATETSAQATVVSAAAEQVSKNVQTVATGTEEMTASIREIAKNATDAAKVASSAVSVAEATNASVAKLGESSIEIGNVIKVITSIAQQTNLLALNATIEAARAGEAGKGFAVVANEVKELAKETAKATEDISRKIEAIQTGTQEAVEAIGRIGGIIAQINDAQNTIASAVEEQTATTNEMARNVDEASKGSSEIAQNITVVAQAAESTTSGARDTQTAAGELARMAAELQSIVSRFRFESGGAAAVGSESAAGASRKPAYSPRRRTGDTLRAAA